MSPTIINASLRKILLVRNDNIGDLICTTPAIEALRKVHPNAQIDIVVNSYNVCAILQNPFVNNIFSYTKTKHAHGIWNKAKAACGLLILLWRIRQTQYDAVVVIRSQYSKHPAIFARAAKAPHMIGATSPHGDDPYTYHVGGKHDHEVLFCYAALEPLGVTNNSEKAHYHVDPQFFSKFHQAKNALIFHISSRSPENQYPIEKFRAIINELSMYPCIITALPEDKHAAEHLAMSTHASYLPTQSFDEVVAIIAQGKLFITLDGGAMHAGAATGVPTVAIMGKQGSEYWAPWAYRKYALHSTTGCAHEITIDSVLQQCRALLSNS
ncbi:glycosyltransferase family 9 protein [Chrysiogenes arsenatis]|uniref:glycosyltransferase family 9 protein n=1 Tax=Chrysiogenes arsenatis TaxID=309797 RepID=UPI00042A920E|nr:glycosyltransferase family 9 protein [Chrysiogenes arsenatis]